MVKSDEMDARTRNPYEEFGINLLFLEWNKRIKICFCVTDALLADLQNTVSPGGGGSSSGYGSLNTSRDGRHSGAESPASRVDAYNVRSVSKISYAIWWLFV